MFLIEHFHDDLARTTQIRIAGNEHTSTDRLAVACYRVLQEVYEKEYSEIMDIFYGIQVSEISELGSVTDRTRQVYSIKPEQYFMLDIPIPDLESTDTIFGGFTPNNRAHNLYDCLDLYVNPEVLADENAWYNEQTQQKETVMKRVLFWNFPPILVITLKRFGGPHGMTKRTDRVDFPLENLVLEKYVSGYHPSKYVYDLFGVCNHMGGMTGGHYTAFAKNFKGEWVYYDDNVCEIVPPDRVETTVVTPHAYCLFYRIR
jgi:uncharacterized UBP type Zn finger protein